MTRLCRIGLVLIIGLLMVGIVLSFMGHAAMSTQMLRAACALLVAIPTVSVVAVFVEELRRREWLFVAIAGLVLVLLAYNVVVKVVLTD